MKKRLSKPRHVQIISPEYMENCDIYPFLSIHEVQEDLDTGTLWMTGHVDSLHKDFKVKDIDLKGKKTKECAGGCLGFFLVETEFNDNMCPRCAKRYKK